MRTVPKAAPFAAACILLFALGPIARGGQPAPLTRAHAHNDYVHPRPLFDALEQGFCSVEADIYPVGGQLLVAHNPQDVKPERTLEALYLDPLMKLTQENGGSIYPKSAAGNPAPFILLIDIKSDGESTYALLKKVLAQYASMLTVFKADGIERKAVTVYISGDRPREALINETPRLAAMDGRIPDLDSGATRWQIPLISESWIGLFKWFGSGPMPDQERAKLRDIITKAHDQGRIVRFWATPDKPAVWDELLAANVDLINADNLKALRQYFDARNAP
ncbi:hypothetical protein HYR69_03545 [Candidatus Sumerlaeota bacterium]|nr:hypothetical protein [Candidatus Sumerlaeota bacterium]MBI3736227.1 hypothetical protein [Candidatus Sumerlaeota bacterium]